MAQAALSAAGYGTFDGIRKADTFLGMSRGSAYHEGIYFIAFIGTPSSSGEWILQLGGHHHALNFYFRGNTESPTPYFTGIEPLNFTLNGISYSPLKTKADAMRAMLASLNATQREAAKLSFLFDDVLLGPGDDDMFPTPQGLKVSTLSETQRALVVAALGAWVNDVPSSVAAKFMSAYSSETALADTWIAWATATNLTTQGSYIRIDGPRAWMEIIVQNYPVAGNQGHYHAIWRDEHRRSVRNFRLRSDLIVHQLITHKIMVFLRHDDLRPADALPESVGRLTHRVHELTMTVPERHVTDAR